MRTVALESLVSAGVFRRILVLPFEDSELVPFLHNSFPAAEMVVITKDELRGRQLFDILSSIRKTPYDLTVSSTDSAIIKRGQLSIQLLLSAARSRFAFIKTSGTRGILFRRSSLLFHTIPRVILGLVLSVPLILCTYALIGVVRFRRKEGIRSSRRRDGRPAVLFLRTDLNGYIQTGGSVSHIKGMVTAFLRAGYDVRYVSDEYLHALPDEIEQIIVRPWSVFEFSDELQLIGYNLQLLLAKKKLFGDRTFSLIYQRHSAFNFVSRVLSLFLGIPAVLEVNASEVWVRRHWSRLWLGHLARQCERAAFRGADRLAVISDAVREQVRAYRIDEGKILLTPNAVDPAEFHPGIDGRAVRKRFGLQRSIVVGFIGTFERWHGIETLFDAAVRVARKNRNVKFFLIGDGVLRARLEQKAGAMKLKKKILFPGRIPHAEAPAFLAACDILVSPHLGFDDNTPFFGSPTKLFEYMAMGKPVIASRLGQISDIMKDGKTGFLIRPGDSFHLAEEIQRLALHRRLRTRVGANARRHLEIHYTWDQTVRTILTSLVNRT